MAVRLDGAAGDLASLSTCSPFGATRRTDGGNDQMIHRVTRKGEDRARAGGARSVDPERFGQRRAEVMSPAVFGTNQERAVERQPVEQFDRLSQSDP